MGVPIDNRPTKEELARQIAPLLARIILRIDAEDRAEAAATKPTSQPEAA